MRYLIVLILVAGCAVEGRWDKRGATEDDFYRDRGTCFAQMESVPFASTNQKNNVFVGCMQGKGWYWTEVPSNSGGGVESPPSYRVIQ